METDHMIMYGHSFLVSNVVHVVHVVNPTHSNELRVLYTWAKRGPCVVHRLQLRNWTGCGPGMDHVRCNSKRRNIGVCPGGPRGPRQKQTSLKLLTRRN